MSVDEYGTEQDLFDTTGLDGVLTRRNLLKLGVAAAGGLAVGGLSAAGASAAGRGSWSRQAGVGTVHMLGWQGYDDPKARFMFTRAGGTLQTTYISSNDEILTKLRGGQLGVYDLITINMAYLPALVKAKLIEPLDYSRIPNAKGYFKQFYKPKWNTFQGSTWGAPIQWGDEPLVYRPDLMKADGLAVPTSWKDLALPKFKGKVAMWDDLFGHIIVMAKTLGYDPPNRLTKKQLANVVTWMQKIRANCRVIAASLGDLADILTKGDAIITTQSNEVVAEEIRAKGKPANWATPKEGTWGWCDQFCIPREAPNPTGAYAYIDAILNPKANARMSMDLAEATPVKAAVPHLNRATKKIYGYGNISQSLKHFGFYFLPPLEKQGDIATYTDWTAAWEQIKS